MLGRRNAKLLQEYLVRTDWVALISIVLALIFLETLSTAYLFPIYPDEIQGRFWLSRLPYDFPDKISGAPMCLSTYFQSIPATMYLPGLINWVVHGRLDNIIALRQVGFFVAFIWVGGLALYLYARASSAQVEDMPSKKLLGVYIAGIFIALFSIGVFPFFLVTNRGEQLILPSVVLLVAVFLISSSPKFKSNHWKLSGLIVLYFAAVSLILYGHPKGLFLTPVFIVIGWQLFGHYKSRWPFVIAMSLLVVHIVQDIAALKYAFKCSEAPEFEAMLNRFSFDPLSLLYDPQHFFEQAYASWLHFPKYIDQLGFQVRTDINYLLAQPLTRSASIANTFIGIDLAVLFFTLMLFIPVQYYRKDIRTGRVVTANLVLATLFACTLISATFNLPKNWYDAGYLYALLLIILIFFVGENFSGMLKKPGARRIYLYMGVVAILSQVVLTDRYYPVFKMGYAGPSVSVVNFDPTKANAEMEAVSRRCDIDPVNSNKIIVDDFTYMFFEKSKWPMPFTYLGYLKDKESLQNFFSKADSDGLVVRCGAMHDSNMPYVKREGRVCCISKGDLKELSAIP